MLFFKQYNLLALKRTPNRRKRLKNCISLEYIYSRFVPTTKNARNMHMHRFTTLFCLLLTLFFGISNNRCFAGSDVQSYQNFNHGYCPSCDCTPCCGTCNSSEDEGAYCAPCGDLCEPPCAPICGTQCGISICAIGIAVAAVVAAAAIIIASGNGSSSHS